MECFCPRARSTRKLQIENADVMRTLIQQKMGRGEESRHEHRRHGLLLLAARHSSPQAAALFGVART